MSQERFLSIVAVVFLISTGGMIALSGCMTGQTASSIAAAEVALTTAERAALAYTSLPQCGTMGATVVCSDPVIKAQIKAADNTAYAAVKSAEANTGTIAAATAAISALTGLIPKAATP